MNREQLVEAVANVGREIDALGGAGELSPDSLRVYWRKLQWLREEAPSLGFATSRIEQLQSELEACMSPELLNEAKGTMTEVRTVMDALHPTRDEESRSPAPVEVEPSAGESSPEPPRPQKSATERKQSISDLFGGTR